MTSAETTRPQKLRYACLLPPTADYVTQLLLFPGSHAREPWGLHSTFTLGGRIYSHGREAAVIAARSCDENGCLELDFEGPTKATGENIEGIGVLELDRTGDVPVDIYLSHVHRKTGVYFAYPASMFMGDLLYPDYHIETMENSMFWSGFSTDGATDFRLVVINPFEVPMSMEVALWHNKHGRAMDKMRRIPAHDCIWIPIDEIMPKAWKGDGGSDVSLCVSAPFKILSYMVMLNRRSGIISSADHLHAYQLY